MANNKIFSLGSLVSGGTCGKVFCKFKYAFFIFWALILSRKAFAEGVSERPLRRFRGICCFVSVTMEVWVNLPMVCF